VAELTSQEQKQWHKGASSYGHNRIIVPPFFAFLLLLCCIWGSDPIVFLLFDAFAFGVLEHWIALLKNLIKNFNFCGAFCAILMETVLHYVIYPLYTLRVTL
jgi:hypothetical protein